MSTAPVRYLALIGDTVPGGASRLILMARPALFTNSSEGGKHLGDEAIDRLFASHVHLDLASDKIIAAVRRGHQASDSIH
jgi:hypothetical protein